MKKKENFKKRKKVEANSFREKWIKPLQEVEHGAGKPLSEPRGQNIGTEAHQGPEGRPPLLSALGW